MRILTCFLSIGYPFTDIVYWFPYCTCEIVPFTILSSFSAVAPLTLTVTWLVISAPSAKTFILLFVNVLFAKYVSVAFTVNVAIVGVAFKSTVSFTLLHIGFTTSTTFVSPVSPPGISTPEVIVFARLEFFDVSFILFLAIPTVTIPL